MVAVRRVATPTPTIVERPSGRRRACRRPRSPWRHAVVDHHLAGRLGQAAGLEVEEARRPAGRAGRPRSPRSRPTRSPSRAGASRRRSGRAGRRGQHGAYVGLGRAALVSQLPGRARTCPPLGVGCLDDPPAAPGADAGVGGAHLPVGALDPAHLGGLDDHGRGADRQHRQGDHHEHEDAATPLAQRVAPGDPQCRAPTPHRPASGEELSGSSAPVSSTITPSRRKTTRSAQAACRASWVTITPGGTGVAAGAQQPEDLLAGVGVEGAGRLVGEDQPALADDGAGDGDALLLAARHLVGEPVGEVGDADLLQRGQGEPPRDLGPSRRRARAAGRRSRPRSARGSG